MTYKVPVYLQYLNDRFFLLPDAVKTFHALQGQHDIHGQVAIRGADTNIGRMLGILMGFPSAAPAQPFAFRLQAGPHKEVWTRFFPGRTMRSCLSLYGRYLTEGFGPIRLFFELEADRTQLQMHLKRMTFLGMPLPKILIPDVEAYERDVDGKFQFHIKASWPAGKCIVAYSGTLDV